ncbi:putative molybdopterin synthase [Microsporum audouinii]
MEGTPAHLDPANFPQRLAHPKSNIRVELTYSPLAPSEYTAHVRSPHAGANVLFLGTTRSSFADRPVTRLAYSSYAPMALATMMAVAEEVAGKHGLAGVSIAHRLGEVAVGEESIAVAVSAAHRGPAWRAAEEILEKCKEKVEIWKREDFADGLPAEWRANRDRDADGNPAE